jgi:peroxiredoxin-like protein
MAHGCESGSHCAKRFFAGRRGDSTIPDGDTDMPEQTGKFHQKFRYETSIEWRGRRRGVVSALEHPSLEVSSPPEFKGEPGLWSPEELLVAAVNSCLLMTFLAYAEREELELARFASTAEGLLEHSEGKYRITEVVLKPDLMVNSEEDALLARDILERAHRDCIITNSVRASVKLVPQIRAEAGA